LAGVDEELDALFGLPLGEFTSARNALAKRLRAADAEAAETVRALQKPTISAWTINQLSREDRGGVTALLEAGAALREAQGRLLAGDDASETLRDAAARERNAVSVLAGRAKAVLKGAGRAATQGTLDRIAATLRAAAVSDEGRELLGSGRLTTDLESSGFDLVAASEAAGPQRQGPKSSAPDRRRQDEQRRRKKDLEVQLRVAERAVREAEREAGRADQAAAEARRIADRARAAADALVAELESLSGR
jgi:hypothetical protein